MCRQYLYIYTQKTNPPIHTVLSQSPCQIDCAASRRLLSGFLSRFKDDPLSGTLRILYANRHSQYITATLSCQVKSFF